MRLLLLGIGGAGGRIVNDTVALFGLDPDAAFAIDTDLSDLSLLRNCRPRCIGKGRFNGGGTGGQDTAAAAAAVEESPSIATLFDSEEDSRESPRFAIVVAGLGGGAGSGITPEVLRIAQTRNIPTLLFTVSPFSFEGEERRRLANRSRSLLESRSVVAVHLENDSLASSPDATTLQEAQRLASQRAAEGITLLWRLIEHAGYIGLGVDTASQLLHNGRGRAHFAFATACGDDRVATAASALFAPDASAVAPLLATSPAVAIGVLGGTDLRLHEVGDAMAALRAASSPTCRHFLGTVLEPQLNGTLALAVLVFEKWNGTVPPVENPLPEAPPPHFLPIGAVAPKDSGAPTPPQPIPAPAEGDASQNAIPSAPPTQEPPVRKNPRRSSGSSLLNKSKDYFQGTAALIYHDENLDEPTYARRNLSIHVN